MVIKAVFYIIVPLFNLMIYGTTIKFGLVVLEEEKTLKVYI